MIVPHLCLSPELFVKAFPFHFVFNRNREILQAGDVLQRISSKSLVGSQIEEHFQINRPHIAVDFDAIGKKSNSIFILEFIQNGMCLKGQMMYHPEQEAIFFLGSPWVTEAATLVPLGINWKDFAIHDPITDFLFLLQAKNNTLADTKKLTLELQNALNIKEKLTTVAQQQAQTLEKSLRKLQQTHAQLIQAEKMSSLGQLVAGVAHEINNPINFIHGNLTYIENHTKDLLNMMQLYQKFYGNSVPQIQDYIQEIQLEFILDDLPKIIHSMKIGSKRITEIVLSLRNFSRLDEAEKKKVDIHQGIDSTLLILNSRLRENAEQATIEIVKNYGNIPLIDCYPGQLNQVFMNIISNAIDALNTYNQERAITEIQNNPSKIMITTEILNPNCVVIRIADNASGMTEAVKQRLFDPFFTTKPVGKGTGLGLSISHQIIVEKHGGKLSCKSKPGQGTEFWIEIPISINKAELTNQEHIKKQI
ncbi:ATP-binding protein [Nodularia sp. NIES-3585]|uniref:ATP-binding protein n=1 Tax=Nodularia sp. NIES-3585 TaxID=1973477 RepID=UPI000B5C9B68|nr:ATP-binding protein [Nodularia sp. NIES-3585]GAX36016.1 histidine kinase [Nodularia sp. NIES-3585]